VNRATLTEQHLYGASRLGMRRKDLRLNENGASPYVIPDVQQNTLGNISNEIIKLMAFKLFVNFLSVSQCDDID